MSNELASIGLHFEKWQDAVEAAIASGRLQVTGEVRGGQLVQYSDPSGAAINILAVEPFATFAGFTAATEANAHITMLNDVLALAEMVNDNGDHILNLTCNLAQGPLIVDEPTMQWQQLCLTGLGVDVRVYPDAATFKAEGGAAIGLLVSNGAAVVDSNNGSAVPDASAVISAEIIGAEYRYTTLTDQRFIHLQVLAPVPMEVCIPDAEQLPTPGSIVAGTVMLVGTVAAPASCGDGCDSCSCGGH